VTVAAYSLPRGVVRDRSNLRAALFDPALAERHTALAARIEQLEAKLRAIEDDPAIDDDAIRAAITHTRLVCGPDGYAFAEVDAPPPPAGAEVEHDGASYTVWTIKPSPIPGDRRRCAVLT
jgi:hypothetical protein